ncbi:response regulator transcription factor [Sinomonas sp. B1-1]|uniref:response regulator transcription factor n=1 Tax=Sinomonas sp. B1-1 TaxID=3141454 RepID=UPI003D2DE258
MADAAALHLARAADLRRSADWRSACEEFRSAGGVEGLEVDDLERFAECAQIAGFRQEAIAALERSFALRMRAGKIREASASAFWLWEAYVLNGEFARGGGWMAKARQLAQGAGAGNAPGWPLIAEAYGLIGSGAYEAALPVLQQAREVAMATGDADLHAFSTLLGGRALLKSGQRREGLERLDEAMLGVLSGKTSPRVTSLLFCAAIGTCHEEVHDDVRVREWSVALGSWLHRVPPFGRPFYGNCLTYRAADLRLAGRWREALAALEEACRLLAEEAGALVVGHAHYERAESHRLLGHAADAEAAYRAAAFSGGPTQPGLALLRLSLGDVPAAAAGILRALSESEARSVRAEVLPAAVTVLLAAGEATKAREAADELAQLAEAFTSDALRAACAAASGEIAIAEQDWRGALPLLRTASNLWRSLAFPYETARTAMLIAKAYRLAGDAEAALIELAFAREVFRGLGAGPDLAEVERLLRGDPAPYGLTSREVEVLKLVTLGLTNRAIADRLYLSERTVHRHLSNIFVKLGVASRTEAATCAVDRGIVILAQTPAGGHPRRP